MYVPTHRPLWQILYVNVKANKSYGTDTKSCKKPYKFDLDVKRRCRIGIMNVRNNRLMVIDPCVFYLKDSHVCLDLAYFQLKIKTEK